MTIGIGGSTQEEALGRLRNMLDGVEPIAIAEYLARIDNAQRRMKQLGLDAIFLSAGANLEYFTGVRWSPSERMVGAVLPANGALEYLAPAFEEGTIRDFMVVNGPVNGWQEHESPYRLLLDCLQRMGIQPNTSLRPCIGLCPSLPFFMFDGLRLLDPGYAFTDASAVTSYCRQRKTPAEIALMQRAKDMTLEVHKAAASILHEGISTTEVVRFIELAHRAVGAPGSTFCIVLFGEASAFPHGVKYPQTLKRGDMVLIDTGCRVHSYLSDITRTSSASRANTSERCGPLKRTHSWPRSLRPGWVRAVKKWTRRREVRSKHAASDLITSCRGFLIALVTGSGWKSMKAPIWFAATRHPSTSACVSAMNR